MTTRRDILGIMLTKQCNLDCDYCYIREKKDETISLDVAKEAIEEAFHTKGHEADELEIDFVGAEPLGAFEPMKEICDWVWAQTWSRPYVFFTSTNGTLLTDTMKQWFTTHKDQFSVGLSYDGIKHAQDVNRSGSYDAIDLEFFLRTWPKQWLKMTISEKSVPYLSESILRLHSIGARFTVNCAFGEAPWKRHSFRIFAEQLAMLVRYYLEHPEVAPVEKLFGMDLQRVFHQNTPGQKHCGAGTGYSIVDTDGKKYPCHIISPLVLKDTQLRQEGVEQLWKGGFLTGSDCNDCVLDDLCPICHGMSLKCHDNLCKRDSNTCMQFKIQVMAHCKLVYGMILQKEKKTAEDIKTLKAVEFIRKVVFSKPDTL